LRGKSLQLRETILRSQAILLLHDYCDIILRGKTSLVSWIGSPAFPYNLELKGSDGSERSLQPITPNASPFLFIIMRAA
jgi:hypothetical protein